MFRGAESWIKYAVWTQMPPSFRLQLETMDVLTNAKVKFYFNILVLDKKKYELLNVDIIQQHSKNGWLYSWGIKRKPNG